MNRELAMLAALLLWLMSCGCTKGEPTREQTVPEQKKSAAAKTQVQKKAASFEGRRGKLAGLVYYEVVRGKAGFDDPLFLVVALHGMGDRPDTKQFPDFGFPVRVVWPQAPTPHQQGFQWFPFESFEKAPHHLAYDIEVAADKVMAFMEAFGRARKIKGKPVVVGFSQGGMISLVLAIKYPELIGSAHPIAAALPLTLLPAGYWDEDERTPRMPPLRALPTIRALHGVDDIIISVYLAKDLNVYLRRANYDAELRTFEDAGHVLSPKMDTVLGEQLVKAVRACAQMKPFTPPPHRKPPKSVTSASAEQLIAAGKVYPHKKTYTGSKRNVLRLARKGDDAPMASKLGFSRFKRLDQAVIHTDGQVVIEVLNDTDKPQFFDDIIVEAYSGFVFAGRADHTKLGPGTVSPMGPFVLRPGDVVHRVFDLQKKLDEVKEDEDLNPEQCYYTVFFADGASLQEPIKICWKSDPSLP